MRLVLDRCEVRSWRRADAAALARLLEGRLRRSVLKDGELLDQLLYALVR